jgi:hypothetical protein
MPQVTETKKAAAEWTIPIITFASYRLKCAISFRFWEGSRYFWSGFFSGFPVFLLFIF